jgi:glucuronoarabinoxylan endo-1,4-beta-xylanase
MDGFGGSSAWCGALSDAQMDVLYKNGPNQLGFTILRLRIDPDNTKWADEKSNATKGKARGATVFATPWSPPVSMKTVNNVIGGAINTSKFADFAAWMKSFWTNAGEGNVDIMSIQNEPDFSPNYECCTWTAQNFLDFCKTYAPQIGKPIMMPEGMDFNPAVSDAALNDSVAASHITYVAGHLYGGAKSIFTYTKALDLKKHVWATEYNVNYSVSAGMDVAKQIFECMKNEYSAYVWWWMTYNGTNVVMKGTTPNGFGYIIAQFSKWVRPGYYRVEATYNPQTGVYVVAFKGTQVVVVVLNNATSSKSLTFNFSGATVTSLEKYTSSQSKNIASDGSVTVTNNSFSATLDAQSVTTFVSPGSGTEIIPFRSEDGKYGNEKAKIIGRSDAVAPCIYLANGKRGTLPVMNGSGNRAPGIYVVPGNALINLEKGKTLIDSKK